MLRIFAVVLSFTSELFTGHFFSTLPRQTLLQQSQLQHPLQADVSDHHDWVKPMHAATPLNGVRIGSRKSWIVKCDSEQDQEHSCQRTIDGDGLTFWLTNRKSSTQPSVITVDLQETQNVSGIAVEPRQDNCEAGNVAAHEVYLSNDGENWADPVSYGTWWSDRTEKYSSFETHPARYVRLAVFSDANSTSQTAIAEFNVYTDPSYTGLRPTGNVGKWGPTINTPIVPVTGFVDPLSHKVVLISSKRHDNFAQDRPDYTLTALWDPVNKSMSQAKVEDTNHNMFCPGTAFDAEGRMIVSGGATGTVTSIFDGAAEDGKQWHKGANLIYTRGYQAAVLNADGRMFVLGGSWGDAALDDPEQFIKDGEVYDPKTDTWTLLPGCQAEKMMTNDREYYRRDNHAWLFAWKNDTVFHAGPSKNMNWYTLLGEGGWQGAGTRTPSDGITDDDAMCGQAIMYDAVQGNILTFGGAKDYYKGGPTSNRTFHLTLGEPNSAVHVERAEPMGHGRTYATAVVVPNGDVLIAGGQDGVPMVFNDQNPVLQAEMYSPTTGHWTQLATNSIVRVYHSITLLLPDATIISGGGGLCGDGCEVNHFDVQIYTPPYLLRLDGQLAPRPAIIKTSTTKVKPGGTILITTDSEVVDASLIRYSATTHTVNADQRRIPLELSKVGALQYQVRIPYEGYVAIPGYWMLFVMDADGVPSVAETIQILIE